MAVLASNVLFMLIRSCRAVQVKLDQLDKKKQLPTTDTVESLQTLIQQYQSFCVPVCVLYQMTSFHY